MPSPSQPPEFSVCIATRNRVDNLVTCLNGLVHLMERPFEVLVLDDASDSLVEAVCQPRLDPAIASRVRFLRHDSNTGYIVARNELARAANAPIIFTLDDDAEVLNAGPLAGLEVMTRDPTIGAVGFAQVGADGTRQEAYRQPAPVEYRCLVPSFSGYAHLVRRDVFLRLGGYRERFWAYGEEKEYCKRLWDADYRVVYLPDVAVRHMRSPSGRSELTRMRYGCRNSILEAIYNEPLLMAMASVPYRLWAYWRWRKVPCKYYGISDAGGMRWQMRELYRNLPAVWRDRRPIRLKTIRLWRRLRATWPAYEPAAGGGHV